MSNAIRATAAFTATVLLLAAATPTRAGAMLQPTAISSPQGSFDAPFDLAQIINQSGLSSAYVSGVTDFGSFTASTTHDSLDSANSGFTNQDGSGTFPQQFTFDLGAAQSVNALAFWAVFNNGAVTMFRLFADSDGDPLNGTGAQIGGVYNPLANGGATGPAQVFSFAAVATRYVHLYADDTSGGPLFPGIGEVAFQIGQAQAVPEPASLAIWAVIGVAGVWLNRRRERARQRAVKI